MGDSILKSGFLVCSGHELYFYFYKEIYSEEYFSLRLDSILSNDRCLIIPCEKYKMMSSYMISEQYADKFLQLSTRYLNKHYLSNCCISAEPIESANSRLVRCVIYSYLSKGYRVSVDDESGLIQVWIKKKGKKKHLI